MFIVTKQKFCFFLVAGFFALSYSAKAQNIGVGIATPLENLHVDSTIKVGKSSTLPTGSLRKNLIKFGDGNFVTIGEEQGDDMLYLRYGRLILQKAVGAAGPGYIGVNTETPTANLDLNGTLRLRGSGAAAGKVLTSDVDGNATWQTATAGPSGAFSARLTSNIALPNATVVSLTSYTEEFDDGNDFNPATGEFTPPAPGVYQFTFNLNFSESGTSEKYVTVYINRDGSVFKSFSTIVTGIGSNYSSSYTATFIVKLTNTDPITLSVSRDQSGGSTLRGGNFSNSTTFSGYRLY